MTIKEQISARFGEAKLAEWRKQHGSLYGYVSEDGKVAVLRSPTLTIIDACRTTSGGSAAKFDLSLLENCWVDGDAELRDVDKYRLGLFDWLGGIIQKVSGELGEV